MSPSPPSHVQQYRSSNSSSPVSSSHLSDDDYDEGAPRSDTATVGSNRSIIGDTLDLSVVSTMVQHPPPGTLLSHETASSRTGQQQQQLPPLHPAAASTSSATTTTTTHRAYLIARAGMQPPENRAQVLPPQRGGVPVLLGAASTTTRTSVGGGSSEETSLLLDTPRNISRTTSDPPTRLELQAQETGNSGAVATATGTAVGGGSQSGASSIKSCGSITGSEADERGETILTTVDVGTAEDVAAAALNSDSEDDDDCGGSLDVEAHSVATMRSFHSQLFQEHEDHSTTAADSAGAAEAEAPASNPSSPRDSLDREQQLPQGMALSRDDDRNEPTVDTTSVARYARNRSPDLDESQGKSSRVRR